MKTPLADRLWAAWRKSGVRGFSRVWGWRRARGRDPFLLQASRFGPVFALDPLGYIDAFVLSHGFYESEVLEALLPHLSTGGALWDIGANFGLHAVTAKVLRPAAPVFAFEPSPAMQARLARNAALNRAAVVCLPFALSDRDGAATLHLAGEGNPGMTTLSPWHEFRYAATLETRVARGDTLVADGVVPVPAAIKLDVEGHEGAVLRGLPRTLRDATCRVIVFEDEKAPDTEAKALLGDAGFHVQPLVRHQATDHPLANFLALKA